MTAARTVDPVARDAAAPTTAQREVADRLGPGRVADLVLATPVGGRGRVDPDGDVPSRELLRVCVSTLAAWCRTAPEDGVPPARAPRRRPWHPAYRVLGTSPQATAVRAALAAAGYAEGGRRATALVVGGPLEAMAAAHWRRRVQDGAGLRWRRLWDVAAARGRLPAALDLGDLGRSAAGDPQVSHVHLVNLHTPAEAVALAGELLGVAPGLGPDRTDPAETDLLRLLNQALATAPPTDRARPLTGDLGRRFEGAWTASLGVPRPHLDLALEWGERLAAAVADGPWEHHGDPRVVVPSADAGVPRSVSPARTLAVGLRVLAELEEGSPWPTA